VHATLPETVPGGVVLQSSSMAGANFGSVFIRRGISDPADQTL
jgi:hypothetical protein